MTSLRFTACAASLLACLVLLSASAWAQSPPATIVIYDACDPETFNAAFGPGTCIAGRHGTTNLKFFLEEVHSNRIAGGWRFNPLLKATTGVFQLRNLELPTGRATVLRNKGGEVHTFTKVEKFGGGFIADLNLLSGNPVPAPECAQILPDGALAPQPESETNIFVEAGTAEPGPAAGTAALPVGVSHWECCIHPWMRLTVEVH
jgi:hypothetical protein